jgi:hypothetical protein
MIRTTEKRWLRKLSWIGMRTLGALLVGTLVLHGLSKSESFREATGLRLYLAGPDQIVRAGSVSEFQRPGIYPARSVDGFWLVNRQGVLFAPSIFCTYDGCATSHEPGGEEFGCPCCSSRYDGLGRNSAGPASAPLRRFRVYAEHGSVMIDRAVVYGEPQWTRPGASLILGSR